MSLSEILPQAISKTEENPVIQWNDDTWAEAVNSHHEYSIYMNNMPIESFENKRCHGYFALLHNIVSSLPSHLAICELGNREGLSTLAILDAMSEEHLFLSIDTKPDLRFVPSEKGNSLDNFVAMIGDCLDKNTIQKVEELLSQQAIPSEKKKIGLLFCDTIHTYEQLSAEFKSYEYLLADEAIILVDDIQDWGEWLEPRPWENETIHPDRRTKYRFFEEWEGEKYDITELCHNPTGFAAFIYRREK